MSSEDAELEALLKAQYEAETLREFMARVSPDLPPPPHLQPLIDLFERTRHEEVHACVSMPPRHGKTHTAMHALAWRTHVDPGVTNCYASYGEGLTKPTSRQTRALALEAGVELMHDSRSLDHWHTKQGGGLIATAVSSVLTGKGINGILLVDDPFKGRADANSGTIRNAVWDWFNADAYTRRQPGASVIVVQTRWHPDDLIGRLLNGEGKGDWENISLPAINADGEALWPDMYPVEQLRNIRVQLGEYDWWSLYQGQPRPKGANVFNEPTRFSLPYGDDEMANFLKGKRIIIGVDPAASEKTSADYSVAVVLAVDGIGPDATSYVIDVQRMQASIPKFVQSMISLQKRYGCQLAVESVGGFKALPQMLRSVNPNLRIKEIHPTTDKFTRAQGAAAAWNDGRIMVPTRAPWVDEFLVEMLNFTGLKDKHDDQVDAMCHAWNTLCGKRPVKRGSRPADFLPLG